VRAVLFDLDGTLLDPAGSIRATIAAVLDEAGLGALGAHEVLVGMPLRDILRLRTDDAAAITHMVRRYRETFAAETWRPVRFYPGLEAMLRRLHARDVPMAVVTTKGEEEATLLLQRLGVAECFAAIVGDDDTRPVKPHPEPVRVACRRLGIVPAEAVMVGDTRYDILAGRAAGTHTIGVLWGHGTLEGHREAQAAAVAADGAELERLLEAWLAVGETSRTAPAAWPRRPPSA
jgi:2-phosphoglycolate phosphatase